MKTFKYTNKYGLKLLSINFYWFGILFANKKPYIEFYKIWKKKL